jgi:hypothetical protein
MSNSPYQLVGLLILVLFTLIVLIQRDEDERKK